MTKSRQTDMHTYISNGFYLQKDVLVYQMGREGWAWLPRIRPSAEPCRLTRPRLIFLYLIIFTRKGKTYDRTRTGACRHVSCSSAQDTRVASQPAWPDPYDVSHFSLLGVVLIWPDPDDVGKFYPGSLSRKFLQRCCIVQENWSNGRPCKPYA